MFWKFKNTKEENIEEGSLKKVNVLAQVKNVDEYFNEANFLSWTQNIFLKIQNAFMSHDFETIKSLETEELFLKHSNQIRQNIENKETKMVDKIAVNLVELASFEHREYEDKISVMLTASMLEYIIDEETKRVKKGNKIFRKNRKYLITFIRTRSDFANKAKSTETIECPSCGAANTIVESGKCEYCGGIIKIGKYDWLLQEIVEDSSS